jgi:hypothetical protein
MKKINYLTECPYVIYKIKHLFFFWNKVVAFLIFDDEVFKEIKLNCVM